MKRKKVRPLERTDLRCMLTLMLLEDTFHFFQRLKYGYAVLIQIILRIKISIGNQRIPIISPSNDFIKNLNQIYPDFLRDFYSGSYTNPFHFKHTNSKQSFAHFIYGIVSHYKIRSIYEIGTYFGTTPLMLINYFCENNIEDFSIHTIDIVDYFSAKIFPLIFQKRLQDNSKKIKFTIGNSQSFEIHDTYDLVIIDGSHKPSDVLKDFNQVYKKARYILFDDLHMHHLYEIVYSKIIKLEGVEEIFRIYTTDSDNKNPHCIGLIKIN